MGEYAYCGSERVKLGTCEDLFYLRADQLPMIHGEDAAHIKTEAGLRASRFRFPWPDEDFQSPGHKDWKHTRALGLRLKVPEGVDHGKVQFRSDSPAGMLLLSLPCPLGKDGAEFASKVHRNGYQGDVLLVGQRYWEGRLWTVCQCGACGTPYRADAALALDIAEAVLEIGRGRDRQMAPGASPSFPWYLRVATRVLDGYGLKLGEVPA